MQISTRVGVVQAIAHLLRSFVVLPAILVGQAGRRKARERERGSVACPHYLWWVAAHKERLDRGLNVTPADGIVAAERSSMGVALCAIYAASTGQGLPA